MKRKEELHRIAESLLKELAKYSNSYLNYSFRDINRTAHELIETIQELENCKEI